MCHLIKNTLNTEFLIIVQISNCGEYNAIQFENLKKILLKNLQKFLFFSKKLTILI